MMTAPATPATIYCDEGHVGNKRMPWSEVCMHLGLADSRMDFEVLPGGMVQLLKDGRPYSAPILAGEAGLYDNHDNDHRFYYYPDLL